MDDRDIIDAEIVDERPMPENRIVQVDPQLEIERLKTRRAGVSEALFNGLDFGYPFFVP